MHLGAVPLPRNAPAQKCPCPEMPLPRDSAKKDARELR